MLAITLAACASPPPPPAHPREAHPAPLAQAAPDPYAEAPYEPGDPTQPPYPNPYVQPGGVTVPVMPPPGPVTPSPPPPLRSRATHVTLNDRAATPSDLVVLGQIERMYGTTTPPGDYWYDAASGAAGRWGGPALGFLPAGLALGVRVPPNASGGGDGRKTGVFLNGRELHPIDVQVIAHTLGRAVYGRWWLDGQGNAGPDGERAVVNLFAAARTRGGPFAHYYRSDGRGANAFVGGGCVTVSGASGSDTGTAAYAMTGC